MPRLVFYARLFKYSLHGSCFRKSYLSLQRLFPLHKTLEKIPSDKKIIQTPTTHSNITVYVRTSLVPTLKESARYSNTAREFDRPDCWTDARSQ